MKALLTINKDFLLNGVFLKIGILGELSEGVKDVMLKDSSSRNIIESASENLQELVSMVAYPQFKLSCKCCLAS